MLTGIERFKVGDAVDPEHHGLAIDYELLVAVL
jgi:hypothetical protein